MSACQKFVFRGSSLARQLFMSGFCDTLIQIKIDGSTADISQALLFLLDHHAVLFRVWASSFSVRHRVHRLWGNPSSIKRVLATLSAGKAAGEGEADLSPLSNAEVKNACSYTSTPAVRLHGVALSLVWDTSS